MCDLKIWRNFLRIIGVFPLLSLPSLTRSCVVIQRISSLLWREWVVGWSVRDGRRSYTEPSQYRNVSPWEHTWFVASSPGPFPAFQCFTLKKREGLVHVCTWGSGRNVIHHAFRTRVTETQLIVDTITQENKSLKGIFYRAITEVAGNKQVSFAMISSIVKFGYFVLFTIVVLTYFGSVGVKLLASCPPSFYHHSQQKLYHIAVASSLWAIELCASHHDVEFSPGIAVYNTHVCYFWCISDVKHVQTCTRPSRFSVWNIEKLGMGLGTRLPDVWYVTYSLCVSWTAVARKIQYRADNAVIIQRCARMYLALHKHRPRHVHLSCCTSQKMWSFAIMLFIVQV